MTIYKCIQIGYDPLENRDPLYHETSHYTHSEENAKQWVAEGGVFKQEPDDMPYKTAAYLIGEPKRKYQRIEVQE